MKLTYLFAAVILSGCTAGFKVPRETATPNLAPSIGKAESVQKLNRKALDSAEELRRIDAQSKTTLEQLDDKIVRLLEK